MRFEWMDTGVVSVAVMLLGCSSSSGTGSAGTTSGTSDTSGSNSSGGSGASSGAGSASGSAASGSTVGSSGSGSSSGASASGSGSSGSGSGASSGQSGDSGPGTTVDSGITKDGESTAAAYPSGPYCTAGTGSPPHLAVGCVLPNVSWMGYDDEAADALASTKPYAAYSLKDVFDSAQKSGKKYAMLNLAEFDCPGCQESAGQFGAIGDAGVSASASVVQAGGVFIELLETAGFANVAPKTDLDSWVSKYKLNTTTMGDPGTSSTPSPSLAFFGTREQAYIIDLATMKVLQYINGDITGALGASATSGFKGMAAMHTLLGK